MDGNNDGVFVKILDEKKIVLRKYVNKIKTDLHNKKTLDLREVFGILSGIYINK